ncbi:monovalent cation/H+ antiporter subunit D family protein [Ramlibacter sp. RBP-2]|uniref:Monovalent cation/H+ antiporter subunit D family protein n=1 Tax=Ramlibacter lithotrophicus TaxID=2606681 RepID=A0A7X6I891_9BURK|nr:monovalent cation/H+ antiporter subunit D family protein [Ramlibacter lithotrophicus]NKE68351.1 monovalent cation/H+ antiporter subunit D family protein [Ramlibacter lithotrophicus]
MTAELAILAALAIPAGAALLIRLCAGAPNLRETVTLAAATALFLAVLSLLPAVLAGERPGVRWLEPVPGIAIAFEVEPLGMLFALVASLLWIVSSVYSIGYMRANEEHHQTRFYICFALALASTIGIAFSANLLTLFLFYEALTLATYPLVTHHGDEEARRGGRTYLGILLLTSTVLLFPAIVGTWLAAGTLDFRPGGILAGKVSPGVATALLVLFMFGVGKAALMPFHRWLPAAMVAPTPVSALLHAVAVVKAGVFSVVKIAVYVFGLDASGANFEWLVYVAGFTIIAASIVALRADNLKRRLAYSTVSQLSYVVLGVAVLAPISVAGAMLHIAAHAFSKITLFFAAGSIYTAAHKTQVSQLDGIGRRMPWTMGAFTIGALSLIGIPPGVGLLSKWYMLQGSLGVQQWTAAAVMLGSTLLNAAYFMPIVYAAFFRPAAPDAHGHEHGDSPLPMVAALTFTAAGTVALFFFPELPMKLATVAAGLP